MGRWVTLSRIVSTEPIASNPWLCSRRSQSYARSGNSAFDDYREREMRRLDEERRKLEEERQEFEAFVQNLRRARDQEEFDRFMRDRGNRPRPGSDTIDL